MMLPFKMPIVDLRATARELGESGQQVKVLWQEDESLAFVARGRDYRSEFHINPSDELMYQISGTMRLHYRTPEGKEDVAVISEGSIIYTPPSIPIYFQLGYRAEVFTVKTATTQSPEEVRGLRIGAGMQFGGK